MIEQITVDDAVLAAGTLCLLIFFLGLGYGIVYLYGKFKGVR